MSDKHAAALKLLYKLRRVPAVHGALAFAPGLPTSLLNTRLETDAHPASASLACYVRCNRRMGGFQARAVLPDCWSPPNVEYRQSAVVGICVTYACWHLRGGVGRGCGLPGSGRWQPASRSWWQSGCCDCHAPWTGDRSCWPAHTTPFLRWHGDKAKHRGCWGGRMHVRHHHAAYT